jgi:hypothetical protein
MRSSFALFGILAEVVLLGCASNPTESTQAVRNFANSMGVVSCSAEDSWSTEYYCPKVDAALSDLYSLSSVYAVGDSITCADLAGAIAGASFELTHFEYTEGGGECASAQVSGAIVWLSYAEGCDPESAYANYLAHEAVHIWFSSVEYEDEAWEAGSRCSGYGRSRARGQGQYVSSFVNGIAR